MPLNLEQLLKRPRIEKPHEEFLLPAPALDPIARPVELPPAAPEPTLADELVDEAARLQELLDLVLETAEDVTVPVPPGEQLLLGPALKTSDYLNAIGDPSPRGQRTRDTFETGLLDQTTCGASYSWPVLAAPRLAAFRDGLLGAVNTLDSRMIGDVTNREIQERLKRQQEEAAAKAAQSPKSLTANPANEAAYREMMKHSQRYRSKFGQAVGSMYRDLGSEVTRHLFVPALQSTLEELRPQLREIAQVLRLLKDALCLAMTFRMLEFRQVRQALEALFEQMALEMFLQILTQLIEAARQQIINPILDHLNLDGSGGGSLGGLLTLAAGRSLSETIYGAFYTLTSYHNEILSDLILESEKRTQGALDELQVLAERNVIGRWIYHLDQAITLCDDLLSGVGVLNDAQDRIEAFVKKRLLKPPSSLYDRMNAHREYRPSMDTDLDLRALSLEPRV